MKLRWDMKTILIVDDDPDVVESIRRILRVNEYKAFTAGDGEECIHKVNEGKTRPYPIIHHNARYAI